MSLVDDLRADERFRAAVVDELLRDPAMRNAAIEALRDPAWAAEALASQRPLLPAAGTMVELGYAEQTSVPTIQTGSDDSATDLDCKVTVSSDGSPIVCEVTSMRLVSPASSGGVTILMVFRDGVKIGAYPDTSRVMRVDSQGANSIAIGGVGVFRDGSPPTGSLVYGVYGWTAAAAAGSQETIRLRVCKVAPTPRVG